MKQLRYATNLLVQDKPDAMIGWNVRLDSALYANKNWYVLCL